jgi:hypothetical protein
MPTFDEVYNCLLTNKPGYAQGSKGGEYDLYAREINGVRTIDAQVRNGGHVYIHSECWGSDLTCQGTRAGGIYNNPPHSIYDWYASNCQSAKNNG